MSSLIQQYIETLFRKNKRQTLIRHILNKDSKMSSLIRRHIKILSRKDRRRTLI